MIKFMRRDVGCWDKTPPDFHDRMKGPMPVLEFDSEKELFQYINDTLPWTKDDPKYQLRIEDNCVVFWSVMGYILP